ncbi:polyprenyl synthetase family protein [Nesterenkonia sp. NBAIMH1]|uniref:polyprenyl synthetase family protein n=1 Tax=Nesterenkonia sp. NBAIMH1 TaxID=2600320 RepID=UPI0011B5DB16|nr:polyprenyl synthetase family protein [Nesterenkonia sp. NBAIMH1]
MPTPGHAPEPETAEALAPEPSLPPETEVAPETTPAQEEYVTDVNARLRQVLHQKRSEMVKISAEAGSLAESLLALTSGGKKLRPVLAWVGWRAAAGESEHPPRPLVELGVALELFQAAALVHDDVIDRSSTRRGQPSTHTRFEHLHANRGYSGSAPHFGTSGAILTGDLSLSWASEAFENAGVDGAPPSPAAREIFRRMHTEVITGQYLDLLSEVASAPENEEQAVKQARNVLTYKAAKYSTEYPIALGCALADGSEELRSALSEAGLPLGEAFQLRDDLLGVFGDPSVTGKPVGDDLREGKRTELIAYGLHRSSPAEAQRLESMLGNPELSEHDVADARDILTVCGAMTLVEEEITKLTERSAAVAGRLVGLGVSDSVAADFDRIAQRLAARTS